MQASVSFPRSLALFCKVVDNFGDIGICWRLARQLHAEHGVAVTLWVDDLHSFARLCPAVAPAAALQVVGGVEVRHWRGQDGQFAPDEVADVVCEFFACDIAPGYIEAMARRLPRPLWFNLEGLSAEEWVEGCHTLPSMHPRLPLTKYFFFPGFTARTGGLLREAPLDAARRLFQASGAPAAAFLGALGVPPEELAQTRVSLFCYPDAPLDALLAAWQAGPRPLLCLVPEGVAGAAMQAFLAAPAVAGAVRTRGALTVRVLPFVPQDDYDRLLWSCDVNFVRGEDSFVRAQWAARPFVWHIYPQDEQLHHKKLRAFLARYAPQHAALAAFSLAWNRAAGAAALAPLWHALEAAHGALLAHAENWRAQQSEASDFATQLLQFARAQPR